MSPLQIPKVHIKVSPEPSLSRHKKTPTFSDFPHGRGGGEGQNHPPGPSGYASFDATGIQLPFWAARAYWWLISSLSSTNSQIMTPKSFLALNQFIIQPVFISGVATIQMQYLSLGCLAPHKVPIDPFLEVVKVTVDGISCFRSVSCITHLCFVCKLTEGVLNPTVYTTDEVIKQHLSQHGPLRNTTQHRHKWGHI